MRGTRSVPFPGFRAARGPEIAKLDRGSLRLEADRAVARIATSTARDFVAIHPVSDLTVDAPDVVVVPLVDAARELLGRERSFSVRGGGGKWLHASLADREDIAVAREPVRFLAALLLVAFLVAEIENLNLGPVGAEETWKLGLLPYMGALAKVVEMGVANNVFERTRDAFEEESADLVERSSGHVPIRGMQYRMLSAIRL